MTCRYHSHRVWCVACDEGNALHYTLAEWQTLYGFTATPFRGGAMVLSGLDTAINGDARADLFDLADYVVSACTGGSIWLRPTHL